jgi:hypothetical protein
MSDAGIVKRFWEKVEKTPDCWLWVGTRDQKDYGKFWNGTTAVIAHRYAYELLVGPIPDGLHIDHLCRVHRCVNPDHLEAVTNRENVLRGEGPTAINAAKTHCIHGHEFTPENTITNRLGHRWCRTCHIYRLRRRRRERAAEADTGGHE